MEKLVINHQEHAFTVKHTNSPFQHVPFYLHFLETV